MSENIDRCSRIAELLLIENEVLRLEDASTAICVSQTALIDFDYWKNEGVIFSPIEKIMFAILERIKYRFWESYKYDELRLQCQKQIGQYQVDFLVSATFSDTQIVIECDGHDFHEKTKEQAKHDKERDRWLTSQGYKILRYTGSEIYNDFDKIEKELSKLLDVPYGISLFEERKQ